MLDLTEVALTEARQGGTVKLRATTHVVIVAGHEILARDAVVPGGGVLVAASQMHRVEGPVLPLDWQEVALLDDQDRGPAVAQRVGQSAATHPRADDRDVGVEDVGWIGDDLRRWRG